MWRERTLPKRMDQRPTHTRPVWTSIPRQILHSAVRLRLRAAGRKIIVDNLWRRRPGMAAGAFFRQKDPTKGRHVRRLRARYLAKIRIFRRWPGPRPNALPHG